MNTTPTQRSGSTQQLLLLIIPNMVATDPTTLTNVNKAFDNVGTLHNVSPGIYWITTDKLISSWGDQVKSTLGVDFNYFVFPVDAQNLTMFRAYLPQDMIKNVQQIRAA